jgi:hypothetical protein
MQASFESHHPKTVIARFMRATQFVLHQKKMGCPDEPGNDGFGEYNFKPA